MRTPIALRILPTAPANAAGTRKPVRPRDAASLVLLRHGTGVTEVLMGKRARQHKFLPDVYVFPGGRLDAADLRAQPLRPLPPSVTERLADHCSPRRAQALAVTAVRETFEETGLTLGTLGDSGLRPDLGGLDYLARAITPSASPIRFHARFFLADGGQAEGSLGGSGELIDLHWISLEAALRLPLADVTEFLLGELLRRPAGLAAVAPVWSYRNGAPLIRRR